ncbi:MAG: bifunctional phosphoribosylaminoimidazolecarboxamide formyltransferase/IMP cyclohydrolase [Eubacteriales bacterium]
MRALISVSNKEGIVKLAEELEALGVELISTGGSYQRLKDSGITVTNVSDITKFQECLDGRVKTLHPTIHAGILAVRSNESHMNTLKELDITPIDIVIINLYPFKETISTTGVTLEEAIENIDIGGPTMLRAGAKNYQDVAVVTDPKDYDLLLTELKEKKEISLETKTYLAAKVFEETAFYDSLIAEYLRKRQGIQFPEKLTVPLEKAQGLRYGENPHQAACFYKEPIPMKGAITEATQLAGKELSYNNIGDANAAINLVKEFPEQPCVVAIKHATPCGVALGMDLFTAYEKAYACDPQSIFGGIVATNQLIDEKTAKKMCEIFLEVIIAPSFSPEALEVFQAKENLRLLKLPHLIRGQEAGLTMKKVTGGMLVQEMDVLPMSSEYNICTERIPSGSEITDMIFAMKVCKHTASNAIVFAKDGATIAVGGGQVSRVWSVENCADHMLSDGMGAVMASDAFFPFPDSIAIAAKAGIKAIIQPGGSKRDQSCIDACNQHGIAMIMTDVRHFRH